MYIFMCIYVSLKICEATMLKSQLATLLFWQPKSDVNFRWGNTLLLLQETYHSNIKTQF